MLRRVEKLIFYAAVMLLASARAAPDEIKHAPTLDSCMADLNRWISQIPGYPNETYDQNRSGLRSLTAKQLDDRRMYLAECMLEYPALTKSKPGEMPAIMALASVYEGEVEARYFDFLVRHNILQTFTSEDVQGKR